MTASPQGLAQRHGPRLIRGPETPTERALAKEAAALGVLAAFVPDSQAVRLWARDAERVEVDTVDAARQWLQLREAAA